MRTLRWSDPAKEDLAAIDAYWWLNNPPRADAILDHIRDAGLFLAEVPGAGPVAAGRVRKWRVRGTDYVLLYRSEASILEILRIRHVRENWWPDL